MSDQAQQGSGLQAVLALPGFRLLWLGQIFSQLADKFYIVLMVFLIAQNWAQTTDISSGPLAEAADLLRQQGMGSNPGLSSGGVGPDAQLITLLTTGIFAANTLPAILLGSLAGVWADRWPKRAVMVASNGLRTLITLAVPFMLLPGPSWLGLSWGYWGLLVITFLESCLTQFFAPAELAAIPLLVDKPLLLPANSLYTTTTMAATIVGFALGEPVMQLLRQVLSPLGITHGEFALVPLAYGIATLILLFVRTNEPPRQSTGTSVWADIKDGLAFLSRQASVRGAMLHLVLLYSLLAALWALSISLAIRVAGLGAERFVDRTAGPSLPPLGARRHWPGRHGLLPGAFGPTPPQSLDHPGPLRRARAGYGPGGHSGSNHDPGRHPRRTDGQGVWPAEQPGEHRPQPAAGAGRHLGGQRWPATGAAAVGAAGVCRCRHGAAMATQLNAAASFSLWPILC